MRYYEDTLEDNALIKTLIEDLRENYSYSLDMLYIGISI